MNTVLRTGQTRDWWNTVALGVAIVAAFLMIWLMEACSSTSQSAVKSNQATSITSNTQPTPASLAATAGERAPAALSNAGEYGENIYDYAKANDWKNVDIKLAALKDAVKNVRTDIKNQSASVERLDAKVAALDRNVTAKNRQATMREANQVTLDVAKLTSAYKLSVPVEVTELDYYGRELEVWAQTQDTNKLQATAREMRQTWESLRPSIETHSATEARKFDGLITRVESAKTPADYGRVATPVLNEVDNLEKLFH